MHVSVSLTTILFILGMIKECKNDHSNCLVANNCGCQYKSVAHKNKTEEKYVCLCNSGFKMNYNDTCVPGKKTKPFFKQ